MSITTVSLSVQTAAKHLSAQTYVDATVHRWYRMRLGFSDHLVGSLVEELGISGSSGLVLDPFCGSGTTIVECKKNGIASVGIDANPAGVFASRVKTNWSLDRNRLHDLLLQVEEECDKHRLTYSALAKDPTFRYLDQSGLLKRGWICIEQLLEAIAIKQCVSKLSTTGPYKDFLTLALLTEVIEEASNVKFGPELYCGPKSNSSDVFHGFVDRAERMIDDLAQVAQNSKARSDVWLDDARMLSPLVDRLGDKSITAVICSPPYPAEHDYTRNSRLELAFLGVVTDTESLRKIKKSMLRCHTKGIYKDDNEGKSVEANLMISKIVQALDRRAVKKDHGFARLYGKVVKEYFGGMRTHFEQLRPLLADNAQCAYVVGDQASYLRVHIPTAEVLSDLACQVGFKRVSIKKWRVRRPSTSNRVLNENVLILKKA